MLDFSEDSFPMHFGSDCPKVVTDSQHITLTSPVNVVTSVGESRCSPLLRINPSNQEQAKQTPSGMSDFNPYQTETPVSATELHRPTTSTSAVLWNDQTPSASTSHAGGSFEENKGKTALHLCAERGNTVMMSILLDHNVDLDVPDGCGRTALHLAVRHGRVEMVSKLLEAGADTEISDHAGFSPIHSAVTCENDEIVRLLMRGGADIHAGIRTYNGTL
ncbi:ankyrin repeat-containing domain protein [Xylariaceae sp. FL1272]|nr:ankyrin repeat-containing domain protein [Xylariaceae sp. FL1272]